MRYLGIFILGCVLGCSVSYTKPVSQFPTQEIIRKPETKKLPKEVQEQFDQYLLTSPILETVVVRIVKKLLETLLITSLIALVTDYPFQVIGAYVLSVLLISYPVTRYVTSRMIRDKSES